MQNCKVSRDLNPPIESKLSRDNFDSIGGFKSRDTLQLCIPSLDEASNLKNTVSEWRALQQLSIVLSYALRWQVLLN